MVLVEGLFSGEVVIPLIANSKCRHGKGLGEGENYFILQKLRMGDGSWQIIPPNDVRIQTGDLFVTCVSRGYYRFEIYGAKEAGVLVEYKDRVTNDIVEVHFKSISEVTDTIINEETGNIADKQFPSGCFRFKGSDFH